MNFWKWAFYLLLVLFLPRLSLAINQGGGGGGSTTCNGAWAVASGDWSVAGNWGGGCVPNGAGDTATLANGNSGGLASTSLDQLAGVSTLTVGQYNTLQILNTRLLDVQMSAGETSLSVSGALAVNDGGTLYLSNQTGVTTQVTNNGTISVGGSGSGGTLDLDSPKATIKIGGTGSIKLSDNANNSIAGNNGTETLYLASGTLSGAGTISNLTLGNGGTITANGTNPLIIKPNPNAYSEFQSPVDTFGIANAGAMRVNSGSTLVLDMSASQAAAEGLSNFGAITVNGGGNLELTAAANQVLTVDNEGKISVGTASTGAGATMQLNGSDATFTLDLGGGLVGLSDNSNNAIRGVTGTETLLVKNPSYQVIGAGTISNLTLVNQGLIVADGSNPLIVKANPNAFSEFGYAAGTFGILNDGGYLQAITGGTLDLDMSASTAATYGIVNSYSIEAEGGTLELTAAANQAATILNTGTIFIGSSSGGTMELKGSGATFTFTGSGGAVTLENNSNNVITGVTGTETLVNGVGSTLSGYGTISNLAFVNQGTLTANALTITPNASGVTNSGTVNVGSGGTLTINGVYGNYTQSAGSTNVNGTLSALSIAINGGTLSGTGTVQSALTTIGGTLMPGGSGSAGTLSFTGNVLLDGVLDEQIAGTSDGQFGAVDVNGTLTLGNNSTLLLSFLNGFTPTAGQDTFTIMDVSGPITGNFSNSEFSYDDETWYVLICDGPGNTFCSAGDPSVILTNMAPVATSPTPEPMPVLLTGLGLTGVGLASRRSRRRRR